MTDVKTLIQNLTVERNAIDKAIAGLQQMSELRSGARSVAAPKAKKPEPWRRKPRQHFDEAMKARIVERMAAASNRSEAARELARELGASFGTIQSGWTRWQKQTNNGATPAVQ